MSCALTHMSCVHMHIVYIFSIIIIIYFFGNWMIRDMRNSCSCRIKHVPQHTFRIKYYIFNVDIFVHWLNTNWACCCYCRYCFILQPFFSLALTINVFRALVVIKYDFNALEVHVYEAAHKHTYTYIHIICTCLNYYCKCKHIHNLSIPVRATRPLLCRIKSTECCKRDVATPDEV